MLVLDINSPRTFDEQTLKFAVAVKGVLKLEHSLASVSKWESITNIPYLSLKELSGDNLTLYIECMTVEISDDRLYNYLTPRHIDAIINYCHLPMTATTINSRPSTKVTNEAITAETLYYQMFSYQIPLECENWHLNKLLTLIQVFGAKNNPEEMKKKDLYDQQREAKRRYEEQQKGDN